MVDRGNFVQIIGLQKRLKAKPSETGQDCTSRYPK